MITVIRETTIKCARKDHECMACLFLRDGIRDGDFTFSEYRSIVRARQDGWKIKKGQSYIEQFNRGDGVYVFKARPDIHKICLKYDLYPEE